MGTDGMPGAAGRPWWRRRPVVLAGAAVAVVVIAALVWWGVGSGTDQTAEETPDGTPTGATSAPTPTPTMAPSTEVTGTPDAQAPTETVPAQPDQEEVTSAIDETAEPADGVEVEVTRVQAVEGEARGIGEVAGPAVRVTIALTNDSGDVIRLGDTLTTMSYGGDETPASDLSGPGVRQFPAQVADGDTARGTFVFSVPEDDRGRVQVRFSYTTAAPAVVFSGPADGS